MTETAAPGAPTTSGSDWEEPERREGLRDVAPGNMRELRLRPDPPRVTRVSRKALAAIGAVAAIGLGGAFIFALEPRDRQAEIDELYSTDRSTPAQGVASLPRDYSAIPKLGPPLPGDLGRPMLRHAERTGEPLPALGAPPVGGGAPPQTRPIEPAVQQRRQEREAARISGLFVSRGGSSDAPQVVPAASLTDVPASEAAIVAPPPPQTAAQRREAFIAPALTGPITALSAPPSGHLVTTGSVIAAALVTGIRSDLPGQVVAQVTQPVHDSATGRTLLIPQGSRLIGTYDSDLAAGQMRLLLAWTRLILPNGRSIDLDRMPAADASGQSGLQDRTDHHWGGVVRAALISTLLGIGAQSGSASDESDIARAIRDGASDGIGRTGRQIVDRELGRPPTLTIRPGYPVRVMLTRDLALPPHEATR